MSIAECAETWLNLGRADSLCVHRDLVLTSKHVSHLAGMSAEISPEKYRREAEIPANTALSRQPSQQGKAEHSCMQYQIQAIPLQDLGYQSHSLLLDGQPRALPAHSP